MNGCQSCVLYVYTMEYYPLKEWKNVICSNIVAPRDYHNKWIKSDRGRILMTMITLLLSGYKYHILS